jgi:hypothetical protein
MEQAVWSYQRLLGSGLPYSASIRIETITPGKEARRRSRVREMLARDSKSGERKWRRGLSRDGRRRERAKAKMLGARAGTSTAQVLDSTNRYW